MEYGRRSGKKGRLLHVGEGLYRKRNPSHGSSYISSAAIRVRRLAGDIRENGIVAPEEAISGELYHKFMNDLAKWEIRIIEVLNGQ